MSALTVSDLLIEHGDLVLDANGEPQLIKGIAAVGQDLKHKIIESNLLYELIAERNPDTRKQIFKQIRRIIEDDTRIKAGTVLLNEPQLGEVVITASALNGETVEIV